MKRARFEWKSVIIVVLVDVVFCSVFGFLFYSQCLLDRAAERLCKTIEDRGYTVLRNVQMHDNNLLASVIVSNQTEFLNYLYDNVTVFWAAEGFYFINPEGTFLYCYRSNWRD